MQRGHDLALGDGLTAAYHAAIARVLLYQRVFLFGAQRCKAGGAAPFVKGRVLLQPHAFFAQQLRRHGADGRGAGKAGRFDARQIEKAREGRAFLQNEVIPRADGAQARKIADILAEVQPRHAAQGRFAHIGKARARCAKVSPVGRRLGIGAHNKVAVHGGRHQHSFAILVRALEDDTPHLRALAFIHQVVFAAAGGYGIAGVFQQGVHLVCLYPRCVEHIFRFICAVRRLHAKAALCSANGGDRALQAKLHAVFHRRLGHGKGEFPRVHNARAGRVQGGQHVFAEVRLHGARIGPAENAQARHAVCLPAVQKRLQRFAFGLAEGQHKAAHACKGYAEPFAYLARHAVALCVQPGHQGARLRVVPRVDDGAVRLGGAVGHIVLGLQH